MLIFMQTPFQVHIVYEWLLNDAARPSKISIVPKHKKEKKIQAFKKQHLPQHLYQKIFKDTYRKIRTNFFIDYVFEFWFQIPSKTCT